MQARKTMTAALTLALLLSAVFAMTASAAQVQGFRPSVKGVMNKAKLVSKVNLAALPKGPSQGISPTAKLPHKTIGRQAQHGNAGAKVPTTLTIPSASGMNIVGLNPGDNAKPGLNAHDNGYSNGFDLEPPDGAVCASNKWVVQTVNDVIRVFNTNLSPYDSVTNLNAFFGLPDSAFVTDPGCYYDADTQRWFVDMGEIDNDGNGPGANIFVAVSTTPDPNGNWNIYAWSSDFNFGSGPDYPADCPCFGDYPQAGADKWSYTLTTNLYPVAPSSTTFEGAQVYALDKHGMAAGLNFVTLAYYNLNGVCAVVDRPCDLWYGLQPAKSPNSDYDNRLFTGLGAAPSIDGLNAHGAEYMLSADDFVAFNEGGPTYANSITVWGLFGTQLLLGDPGFPPLLEKLTLSSEGYGDPPLATQKNGPTPLRDCLDTIGCFDSKATPQLFGKIQTNDDSMQHTTFKFSEGEIFGALNTDVMVPSPALASSAKNLVPALHAGIAYFVVRLAGSPFIHRQGYVAAKGEDIMYPSIGLTTQDAGAMVFSLSGPDYWPSAAYTTWTGDDIIHGPIHIALQGKAPQDGFTEYPHLLPPGYPPRWGDYTAAATVGDKIYLDAEYIGNPACSDAQFQDYDFTCGGTRTFFANWSNGLIKVTP